MEYTNVKVFECSPKVSQAPVVPGVLMIGGDDYISMLGSSRHIATFSRLCG